MANTSHYYQGLCLLNSTGFLTIAAFDRLPLAIKRRLWDSPFNLCPACVSQAGPNVERMLRCIDQMEELCRHNT